MRLIGDVHGKYAQYKWIIRDCPESIQVGDMGVGFRIAHDEGPHRAGDEYSNPPHALMVKHHARFIRGNHDNPAACRRHSQCIPDGTVEGSTMFIGGAVSIDRAWRLEGYSWWPDEELSYSELQLLIDKYVQIKPRVMVTHDCPEEMAQAMLYHMHQEKLNDGSRTRLALQAMLSAHSPELWVFGHWHRSLDVVSNGTRFVCLAELEYKDLQL